MLEFFMEDFLVKELIILFESLFYALVGIIILMLAVVSFDKVFKLDLHKELVEDQNIAFGILFGGLSIAIALIIAAALV